MEVTPGTARAQAFREATDWLILLQEEPDDRDLRHRFDDWRSASPVNAEAWAATQRTAHVAAAMTPAHAAEWEPALLQRRSARRAPRWSRRGIGVAVASMALAACIAVAAVPSLLLQLRSDYTTGTAQQRMLDLPDGSRVTLAPSSAIAVAFTPGERRLRLLEGQAFFEVARDPARPFRVEAGAVEASVLGTSFDVRWDRPDVTVSVQEGIVQIDVADPETRAERLEAGQSVRVAPRGKLERSENPPGVTAAWRKGQLLSHDRPLREAIDQLRRYYRGTIVITDGALAERTVTGVYNLDDPEQALRGIVQAHGGTVRRITPWLMVVSGS
jgi:transmembrane sensor